MNAEVSISLDITAELDTKGVTFTTFFGEESDGTVYTVTYDQLVQDLIELSTYDDEEVPGILAEDRDYILRVADTLEETAKKIRQLMNDPA